MLSVLQFIIFLNIAFFFIMMKVKVTAQQFINFVKRFSENKAKHLFFIFLGWKKKMIDIYFTFKIKIFANVSIYSRESINSDFLFN